MTIKERHTSLFIPTPQENPPLTGDRLRDQHIFIADQHFTMTTSDGVALVAQENSAHLRALGYNVALVASDTHPQELGFMDYQSGGAVHLRKRILAAEPIPGEEDELLRTIYSTALDYQARLSRFYQEKGVQIAHVRNFMSLPYLNMPLTLAYYGLMRERPDILFVQHHHDLNNEGVVKYVTPYALIEKIARSIMAPNLPNTRHIAINSHTAEVLKKEYGAEATFIPDGFDFDKPVIPIDTTQYRRDLGLGDNDLLLGSMVRVRPNKGIHDSIRFAHILSRYRPLLEAAGAIGQRQFAFTKDSRIAITIPQSKDMDRAYYDSFMRFAQELGVTVIYQPGLVVADAQYSPGTGTYPFYSTYEAMDGVLYTSQSEGWGNQAIEAAKMKKPLLMHLYPVAEKDIFPHNPGIIPMGNNIDLVPLPGYDGIRVTREEVLESAARQFVELLLHKEKMDDLVELNYKVFRNLCSIQNLMPQYLALYNMYFELNKK